MYYKLRSVASKIRQFALAKCLFSVRHAIRTEKLKLSAAIVILRSLSILYRRTEKKLDDFNSKTSILRSQLEEPRKSPLHQQIFLHYYYISGEEYQHKIA